MDCGDGTTGKHLTSFLSHEMSSVSVLKMSRRQQSLGSETKFQDRGEGVD